MTSTSTSTTPGAGPAPLRLDIAGMSCGHCVAAVERALAAVPGVRVHRVAVGAASVALEPGTATDAATDAVLAAVHDAGYGARVADAAPQAAGTTCCGPRTA